MIISKVQHAIDSLKEILPKSFIFVLDTMDRSFIYKTPSDHDCIDTVLAFDQKVGIDKLMKSLDFFNHVEDDKTLVLKRISPNTFLGICIVFREYNQLQFVERILLNSV